MFSARAHILRTKKAPVVRLGLSKYLVGITDSNYWQQPITTSDHYCWIIYWDGTRHCFQMDIVDCIVLKQVSLIYGLWRFIPLMMVMGDELEPLLRECWRKATIAPNDFIVCQRRFLRNVMTIIKYWSERKKGILISRIGWSGFCKHWRKWAMLKKP